jgi:biopolymer transport protein ExbD
MAAPLLQAQSEDEVVAAINTTPLVGVMLVLLIIFLITIPVVAKSVPVALPHEANQPTRTKPETIVVAIDREGALYWNDARLEGPEALRARLEAHAGAAPPPEVQIRADREVRYEFVGRVVVLCQRAGIGVLAFITEPDRVAAAR